MRAAKVIFILWFAVSLAACMGTMTSVGTAPTYPVSRTVSLTVISEPAGAHIYQEGIYKGTAPLTLNYSFRLIAHPQPDGSILNSWEDDPIHYGNDRLDKPLTAVLEGYKPQTRQYVFKIDEVARSDSFSILFALEADTRISQQQQQQTVVIPTEAASKKIYGSLNIITTPSQAEIYIDGAFVATTPASGLQLEVGQHKIEIRKDGCKPWVRTLQVLPASPVNIEIALEKN